MITKWKLFNFKSVRRETELELGALTIFAGANSSGKSSLIQSILLISQTLSNRVGSRSVVLNSNLARLGEFNDLRSFSSESDQILVGWECEPRMIGVDNLPERTSTLPNRLNRFASIQRISCDIAFNVDLSGSNRDLMQLQPLLFTCALSVLTKKDEGADYVSKISIFPVANQTVNQQYREINILDSDNDEIVSDVQFGIEIDDESIKEIREEIHSAEPVGCRLRHFLPIQMIIRYNEADEEAKRINRAICDNMLRTARSNTKSGGRIIPQKVVMLLKEHLGDMSQKLLPDNIYQKDIFDDNSAPMLTIRDWHARLMELPPRDRANILQGLRQDAIQQAIYKATMESLVSKYTLTYHALPEDLRGATAYLQKVFSQSVKYLGPLRDEPKPLYPLSYTVDSLDIGLRGEHTAAVFDLHKESRVRFIPSGSFAAADVKLEVVNRSLEVAVSDWLQYMGVADKVQTKDRGKLGHELKVTIPGNEAPHDLTHVGVGVSQVLPILVTCLLADTDTTLIFEQPELHLHPKVQTLLGDFFLSMALLGKQCILETHSEYLINRLRFRAASAVGDSLASTIKIYFAEQKKGEDGLFSSEFRDVVVNRYGAILDWPEGFFDQSQREAESILRAGMTKKKEDRLRRNDNAGDS